METLSIKETLRFGWKTFKSRPWFFAGTTLAIIVAYEVVRAVINLVGGAVTESNPVIGFIVIVAASVAFYSLYSMCVMWFNLVAHDHPQTVSFKDLWHPQPFVSYLVVYLLVTAAVLGGLILLIIPGIIASIMFLFSQYIILEKDLKPVDAMKESMRITKGRRWKLLGLLVVYTLLNIAGAIALLVGLLVTIPVTMLGLAHAYRTLSDTAEKAEPTPAPALPPVSSTVLS